VRAEDDSLAAVYDAHAGALYRYLVSFLGDPEEAEDALQEVFLNLARRPERGHIRDLRPYLFRAAHNQAIMLMRRRSRHEEVPVALSWIDLEACKPADCELALDVDRALRQLPPEQRAVVALKMGEDLTFREIGQVLRIPKNTAASRYRLALARLRVLLEGDQR
jgi:RNA polymerase sigma-70 factor (ECF subfamily)